MRISDPTSYGTSQSHQLATDYQGPNNTQKVKWAKS
jgi:hypothetical protein